MASEGTVDPSELRDLANFGQEWSVSEPLCSHWPGYRLGLHHDNCFRSGSAVQNYFPLIPKEKDRFLGFGFFFLQVSGDDFSGKENMLGVRHRQWCHWVRTEVGWGGGIQSLCSFSAGNSALERRKRLQPRPTWETFLTPSYPTLPSVFLWGAKCSSGLGVSL